jgi:predicted nucleic-acid-binding Zn-ribbon protein
VSFRFQVKATGNLKLNFEQDLLVGGFMKDGICPKCHSTEVISGLWLKDSQTYPPYIEVVEPEPPNRPFIWVRKSERSNLQAYVCGACGYTEFYAANHLALRDGARKGFRGV